VVRFARGGYLFYDTRVGRKNAAGARWSSSGEREKRVTMCLNFLNLLFSSSFEFTLVARHPDSKKKQVRMERRRVPPVPFLRCVFY
jgi:hypothetical protein